MVNKDNFPIRYLTTALVFFGFCIYTPTYSQQLSVHPIVTKVIGSKDFVKYRRLAVLPFADAPNAPQSGQIAQGIASTIFAKTGFQVIERSRLYNVLDEHRLSADGMINEKSSVRLGNLLGVNAVVVGEVVQYQTINRHTDPFYEAIQNPCDKECQDAFAFISRTQGFQAALELAKERNKPRYVLKPGQQWTESYVSLSLRVIDVETGLIIYSAQGQYNQGYTNPPQQLLEYILQSVINGWGPDRNQVESSMTCQEKCTSAYNKGELRKGITIDQCVQLLCN